VASSSDGTQLVAVIAGGGIYTSVDAGAIWMQTGAPSANWQSVASSSDGTHLVAVVIGGGGIYTHTATGSLVAHPASAIDLVYLGGGSFFVADVNGTVDAP
jgi:hypothetical protein